MKSLGIAIAGAIFGAVMLGLVVPGVCQISQVREILTQESLPIEQTLSLLLSTIGSPKGAAIGALIGVGMIANGTIKW